MSWTYILDPGAVQDPQGRTLAQGASGRQEGKNNPGLCNAKNCGPIPQGRWAIGAMVYPEDLRGPVTLPLEPIDGTLAFGRVGFSLRGACAEPYVGNAGDVIVPQEVRELMATSMDRTLVVLARADQA